MTTHHRSKQLGTVVLSVNSTGDATCVDFFRRPNGSFGHEEYRRGVETGEGWFPIGFYCGTLFDTLEDAKADALSRVVWLANEI